MLLFGSLNSSDFTRSTFVDTIQNSWLWTLLVVLLAVVGIVAQTRARVTAGRTVRETWYAEAR
jgi:cytosine/uracil/thiamine/allantoin permease